MGWNRRGQGSSFGRLLSRDCKSRVTARIPLISLSGAAPHSRTSTQQTTGRQTHTHTHTHTHTRLQHYYTAMWFGRSLRFSRYFARLQFDEGGESCCSSCMGIMRNQPFLSLETVTLNDHELLAITSTKTSHEVLNAEDARRLEVQRMARAVEQQDEEWNQQNEDMTSIQAAASSSHRRFQFSQSVRWRCGW